MPANSVVIIAADGGAQTTSTSTTGFSIVDVAILIDGAFANNGGLRRVVITNTTGLTTVFDNWSMEFAAALTQGTHTIQVAAAYSSGSSAVVSGDNNSTIQGALTVTILKR